MFQVKGKFYKIDKEKNDKNKIKNKIKEGLNQMTAQFTWISSPFGGETPLPTHTHTLNVTHISSDITIVIQV